MNKDVIYIEPEDDITDIILKIENSKEKIVALVPPKKAGVFRSVVNIKLIAKAGATSEKSVVLVTVDPSITKLAAATKLPVAKNLQSAPSVPKLDSEDTDDNSEKAELVEDKDGEVEAEDEEDEKKEDEEDKEDEGGEKEDDDDNEEDDEDDDNEDEEEEEKPKKKDKKKSKKKSGGLIGWIKEHKKLSIVAGIALLGIIILLIWMLFIAPAVDIAVSIKTDKKNFSENVTFVDKLEDENAEEGKFYLEQKKIEETQKVEFEATGKKNRGEKAHGKLKLTATFNAEGRIVIEGGKTQFTYNDLVYYANDNTVLDWDAENDDNCEKTWRDKIGSLLVTYCSITATIDVTAAESGTKYNVSASSSGWSTLSSIGVTPASAMEGGTDDVITVVQQSDVIEAQNQVKSSKEEENKEKLFEKIKNESGDKYYIIDSSFEQTTSDDVVTPAVDEEVKEGVKPTLEVKTTSTVYVIDKVKLEEYVDKKAKLDDDQKIYDIKDIYIENMSHIAVGATTKLKAQYFIGPKLTAEGLVDMIKGKGIGDARREISDINGVSDVKIETSYPWVMAVPNDSNKISVRFEIKDQDGNDIKPKDEENQDEGDNGENKDEKKDEDKIDEKSDKKE